MFKILSKIGNIYIIMLFAASSYMFVYAYFVKDMFSWVALLLMLLMVREMVKKLLQVGDTTVTKQFDDMTRMEKCFSVLLKSLVFTTWGGFLLLVFYQDGYYLDNPLVSVFYLLIGLCMIMDVLLYRIRKQNSQFLKDDSYDL